MSTVIFNYELAIQTKYPMFLKEEFDSGYTKADLIMWAGELVRFHEECIIWLKANELNHKWPSNGLIEFDSAEDLLAFRLACGI